MKLTGDQKVLIGEAVLGWAARMGGRADKGAEQHQLLVAYNALLDRMHQLELLNTTCQRCYTPCAVRFSSSADHGIAVYRCVNCGETFRGAE